MYDILFIVFMQGDHAIMSTNHPLSENAVEAIVVERERR